MKKRILSILLVLCLVLSMIPMAVAADPELPTLTLAPGMNPSKINPGQDYLLYYVRNDMGYALDELSLIYQVKLTGNETQEQLNQMAYDLLMEDAEIVYASYGSHAAEGSLAAEVQFPCQELPVGTYLLVIVYSNTEPDEDGVPMPVVYPETAVAVGVTIGNPTDPIPEHTHEWVLERTAPVYPQLVNTENYYVCKICGEVKVETVHNCTSTKFKDVPPVSNWAHLGIDFCVKNGLMNGVSADRFDPSGVVTRAQFVTILWRQAGSPEPKGKAPFTDVKASSYYAKAAAWAYENGVVNGTDATHFSPEVSLTREMCAAILYRYTKDVLGMELSVYVQAANLGQFPDNGSVSGYAKDAMGWANFTGIVNGSASNGKVFLQPKNTATRDQIATIFMRYMDYLAR